MKQICSVILLFLFSCKVDPKINAPLPSDDLKEIIPPGWPQPVYTFSVNTISEDKFILGRSLFYEDMLSKNDSVSCASCHQQFVAFANAAHKFSHGIHDQLGNRNAPGIFNVNWHPAFMHDGGINHIEVQPLGPISNPVEMGEKIENVIAKLQNSEKYRKLFKNAFGDDEVTSQRMLRSMALFMGMMYSYNSKFDQYKRGENGVQLNDAEARGYNLFQAKCNSCHVEPLFSDFKFRNIGLSPDPVLKDSGRYRITKLNTDIYRFKTPSLRNVALTYPYMHDGRYATIEQCIEHYNSGIAMTINLDPLFSGGSMPISAQEKADLVAFLNTLTDNKFIKDNRFADPNFK